MKKFISSHITDIALTITGATILSQLIGYTCRPYTSFGGEDLIPIATAIFWLFYYLDTKENEK